MSKKNSNIDKLIFHFTLSPVYLTLAVVVVLGSIFGFISLMIYLTNIL